MLTILWLSGMPFLVVHSKLKLYPFSKALTLAVVLLNSAHICLNIVSFREIFSIPGLQKAEVTLVSPRFCSYWVVSLWYNVPKISDGTFPKLTFSWFNFIPDSSINFNDSFSLLSCSSIVLPCIKMSSIITWTPSISLRNFVILCWKNSVAEDIPKGNLLKQNLPNGVIKVVSNRLSSSNGIWWNPLVAFNLENIFESLNLGDISSKFGSMKCSLFSTEFNFF